MKKIIGTIIGTVIWGVAFSQTAQTGINTTTPQQTLQVSGTTGSTAIADGTTGKFLVTPTIRIEGLDKTHNPTPYTGLGAIATLPLYATSDGDLVIGGNRVNKVLQTLPVSSPANGNGGVDAVLISSTPNINAVYPAVTTTTAFLKSQGFTLTRTSMVYISVSFAIGTVSNTAFDKKARMTGIKLQFSAVGTGSGIPVNVPFASTTDSYTTANGSNIDPDFVPGAVNVATGNVWYNVSKELRLPPGTYTLQVWGIGTATSNVSTSGAFTYTAGSVANNDNINIIAIAL